MADRITAADSPASVTQLVGGIVADVQTLMRQELQLAKVEIRQEWDKTKTAASAMAATPGQVVGFAAIVGGRPTGSAQRVVIKSPLPDCVRA